MKRLHATGLLLCAMLAGAGLAQAQEANPFIGEWAMGPNPPAKVRGADLVLTEKGGTWRNHSAIHAGGSGKQDLVCSRIEAPVTIDSFKDNVMMITIRFSETMSNCRDNQVKLVYGEDKTVKAFRGGEPLSIHKK